MRDVKDEEIREAVERKDFSKMYSLFESKYNPYPVQMSRSEAFGDAERDGYITEELYHEARKYYGNLWNYVGD